MNLHNIFTLARYEAKLLRRSWLFRIFAALSLVLITSLHLSTQSNMGWYQWNMVALSSSIPFVNIYIFNIAQSIIAIFLAGDFLKRDKKLDTAEVIYVRPMSNSDYIIGKTLGIITVFVLLNILALIIAASINLFASESPFEPLAYLFYLTTLSIPSLIFILGLSFLTMILIRNQAVTLVLLLGFMGVSLIYLGNIDHGAFDFFAITIPNIFSEITGHPNLFGYLTQRLSFMLIGLGLLIFTIALVKRLPQHPKKRVALNIMGILILIGGAFLSLFYVHTYREHEHQRAIYLQKYREFSSNKHLSMINAEISIQQQGESIKASSLLRLKNIDNQDVEPILLYINPKLQVSKVSTKGRELSFKKDNQIVIIDERLASGSDIELKVDYSGGISENICYIDVPREEFYDTKTGNSVLRYGKRYLYLEDRITLLTPETLWYPMALPPTNPDSPYAVKKDFTDYTLKIINPIQTKVLSQGNMSQSGDTIIYKNSKPLPAISLAMGNYEKRSLQLDSINLELFFFKGHDYFSSSFTNLRDTLVPLLRDIKNDYEVRKGRDYPFKKLTLIETPVSFAGYVRNWKGSSEFVQPEIYFLPEMGATLPNANFKLSKKNTANWARHRNNNMEEIDIEIRVIRDFVQRLFLSENVMTEEGNLFVNDILSSGPNMNRSSKLNKYDISAQYFNHVTNIYSSDFPVMDILLTTMMKQEESSQRGRWMRQFWGMNDSQRAAEYLKTNSFEDAILDTTLIPEVFYEMLKLKANYLKYYLLAQCSAEEFNTFMKDFSNNHSFSATDFSLFNQEFLQQFGINLMDIIPEWYRVKSTPLFIVKGVNTEEIIIDDFSKYMVSFFISNPTDVQGIVATRIEEGRGGAGGPGGRGGMGGFGGMMGASESSTSYFIIPPNSVKEVRLQAEERPVNISINTTISQNIPSEISFNLQRAESMAADTISGMFDTDATLFKYNPKEITIDNEDEGFRLIESNQKNYLQSLLNINNNDRYKNMNFRFPPTRWTATVGNNFYGDYIQSGYYKKAGSGKNIAEWRANISIPGFYEVYIYNPQIQRGGFGFGGDRRNDPDIYQHYTITHADGKDEISFPTNGGAQEWISIGNFYFDKGEAIISLNDKGSTPNQIIFADAVRWVYKNN